MKKLKKPEINLPEESEIKKEEKPDKIEEKKEEKPTDVDSILKNVLAVKKTILIRDKWILRVVTEEDELKKELEKKNWEYRLTDKTERFMLIDYDKDEGRFYVKALLAKVNKLKEVKMLWMVIFTLLLFFLVYVASFVVLSLKISDLQKAVLAAPKPAAPAAIINTNPFNDIVNRPVAPADNKDPESMTMTWGNSNRLFR